MALPDFMSQNLWHNFTPENSVILTPNNRLAIELRANYDRIQKNSGKIVWPSALVLPLNNWLQHIWQNHLNTAVLLSANQELVLWRQIIANSKYNDGLLDINFLANAAQQAWNLMQRWQVPMNALQNYYQENSRAFYLWAREFDTRCANKNLLSQAKLPATLGKHKLALPQTNWLLVGFDQIAPAITELLNAFTANGFNIQNIEINNREPKTKMRLSFPDQRQEILAMARWAKQQLQTNPDANIGCVVPNLNMLRNTLEQIFLDVFPKPDTFNISLGKPLNSYPIIDAALKLLRLALSQEIELPDAIDLLHLPFIAGGKTEIYQRAETEMRLQNSGQMRFSWSALQKHVKINSLFINALQKANLNFAAYRQKKHSPSLWARLCAEQLEIWGWPGERSLNSTEYQLVQRWQKLLQEFAALDLVSADIPFSDAYKQIVNLAKKIIFQPEHKPTPINVLGLMEAAGMNFTHLWLLGMDQESWPAKAAPNPLLPIQLQKQFAIPHTSATAELEFAKILTARFLRSADNIVVSYLAGDEDRTLKISPLFTELPECSMHDLQLSPSKSRLTEIYASQKFESIIDNIAPPIHSTEKIRGGSSILKLQALCPFRAFAELRLNAREPDAPQIGLSKMERGTVIHAALEKIWHELGGQQTNLASINDTELNRIVTAHIQAAILKYKYKQNALNEKLFVLEQECLTNLLLTWLNLEKERPPFTIVKMEQRQTVTIGELKLNLCLDRVDRLADGSLIIVDYKTGQTNTSYNSWLGERPDDPQLPLYCITATEPISGLTFARVTLNNMGLVGLTALPTEIPGVKTLDKLTNDEVNWDEQCSAWRQILTRLATDFCAGLATVDPKNESVTCTYCDLKILCRNDSAMAIA